MGILPRQAGVQKKPLESHGSLLYHLRRMNELRANSGSESLDSLVLEKCRPPEPEWPNLQSVEDDGLTQAEEEDGGENATDASAVERLEEDGSIVVDVQGMKRLHTMQHLAGVRRREGSGSAVLGSTPTPPPSGRGRISAPPVAMGESPTTTTIIITTTTHKNIDPWDENQNDDI